MIIKSIKRIANLQQGSVENVINYYKRFSTVCKMLDVQWGVFGLAALAAMMSNNDLKKMHDKHLGCLFLANADKKRYAKLLDGLHNNYQSGNDRYPESLKAMLNLLSNYQDHQVGGNHDGEGNSGIGHGQNFASLQVKKASKICCFECNKLGHMQKIFPKRAMTNMQHSDQISGSSGGAGKTISPWTA